MNLTQRMNEQKNKQTVQMVKMAETDRKTDRRKRNRFFLPCTLALLTAMLLTACGSGKPGSEGADSGEAATGVEEIAGAGQEASADGSGGSSQAAPGRTEEGQTEGAESAASQETSGNEEENEDGRPDGELSLKDYLNEDGTLELAALQEINPDIYGWLEIADTQLSFPLLQSSQDEYFYLSHDVYGEQDDAGCIYTEYFNRKDFSDPNTIIYGRNVEGRFGGLHQYQDRDFFDSHRQINIYLEDRTLTWKIFAAYTYDDRHLIKIYDFWDKDIFDAYLKDVFSIRAMDAYLDDTMEVTADDRIITLSTGVTGQDDKRYLVQAKLQ